MSEERGPLLSVLAISCCQGLLTPPEAPAVGVGDGPVLEQQPAGDMCALAPSIRFLFIALSQWFLLNWTLVAHKRMSCSSGSELLSIVDTKSASLPEKD